MNADDPRLDRYRIIDDGPHFLTVETMDRALRWRPSKEQTVRVVAPCDENPSHRDPADKA